MSRGTSGRSAKLGDAVLEHGDKLLLGLRLSAKVLRESCLECSVHDGRRDPELLEGLGVFLPADSQLCAKGSVLLERENGDDQRAELILERARSRARDG